jgi:hypothetical protein
LAQAALHSSPAYDYAHVEITDMQLAQRYIMLGETIRFHGVLLSASSSRLACSVCCVQGGCVRQFLEARLSHSFGCSSSAGTKVLDVCLTV